MRANTLTRIARWWRTTIAAKIDTPYVCWRTCRSEKAVEARPKARDKGTLFTDEDLVVNENEAFIKSYMQGKLPAYADYSIVEEPYGYRDEHTKERYTVTVYIDLEKVKGTPFVPKKQRVNCDRLFNDLRALCKKRMPKLFVMFTIKRF